jgi:hypothetical protein
MLDRRTAIAALWALAGLIVLAAGPVSAIKLDTKTAAAHRR